MPVGYSDSMRIFIKILKPVYANLRQNSYLSVVLVDHSFARGF